MPMSALHAWCDFFGIPRKAEKKSAPLRRKSALPRLLGEGRIQKAECAAESQNRDLLSMKYIVDPHVTLMCRIAQLHPDMSDHRMCSL